MKTRPGAYFIESVHVALAVTRPKPRRWWQRTPAPVVNHHEWKLAKQEYVDRTWPR